MPTPGLGAYVEFVNWAGSVDRLRLAWAGPSGGGHTPHLSRHPLRLVYAGRETEKPNAPMPAQVCGSGPGRLRDPRPRRRGEGACELPLRAGRRSEREKRNASSIRQLEKLCALLRQMASRGTRLPQETCQPPHGPWKKSKSGTSPIC